MSERSDKPEQEAQFNHNIEELGKLAALEVITLGTPQEVVDFLDDNKVVDVLYDALMKNPYSDSENNSSVVWTLPNPQPLAARGTPWRLRVQAFDHNSRSILVENYHRTPSGVSDYSYRLDIDKAYKRVRPIPPEAEYKMLHGPFTSTAKFAWDISNSEVWGAEILQQVIKDAAFDVASVLMLLKSQKAD